MSVTLAVVLFFALTIGLAVLPLLPAIAEWRDRIDTDPLTVVHESEVDVQRFADVFRAFVQTQFASLIEECRASGEAKEGLLDDDVRWVVRGGNGSPVLTESERSKGRFDRLLIGAGDLLLPGRTAYLRDIYSGGSVTGREETIVRAVLAEGSVELAAASRSLRWLHAGKWVRAGTGSVLHGRVSAGEGVRLDRGCGFERVHAPRVEFGEPVPETAGSVETSESTTLLEPEEVPRMLEVEAGRWLVARELDVPDRARIEADVVVTGTCRVGAGAHVLGSIKSHGDTFLAADVRVDGSVVSGRNLSIGSRCRISGPVIAEMKIDLEAGCRIGSPELPTTVSAPSIGAECGAVAHGTVWARTTGDVRHAEPGLRPSVET